MITLKRLTTTLGEDFSRAMKLYEGSFPYDEKREKRSQEEIMSHPDYRFSLILEDGDFVGEVLYWERGDYIYIEHFCILPECRNRKLGAKTLELLKQTGKRVILEIDPPTTDIAIRRKGFYERNGFLKNPHYHKIPPYHADCDGVELVVMTYPDTITKKEYDDFFDYIKNTVMFNCY